MSNGSTSKLQYDRKRDVALDAGRAFIQGISSSSDVFPPLKTTAGSIMFLWDAVDQFKRNKEDWVDLASLVTKRITIIAQRTGPSPPADFATSLLELNELLDDINREIARLQKRGIVRRFIQYQSDKEKVNSYEKMMNTALNNIALAAHITVMTNTPGPSSDTAQAPSPQEETLSLNANRTLPTPPVHFHGREDFVASVISAITQRANSPDGGASLVIRGPGGIGKTTVARAILNHNTIISLFGDLRHFVYCEATETPLLLLSAILSSLNVTVTKGDALSLVVEELKRRLSPILLVLDNAETFWYLESQRGDIRKILQQVSAIPYVTLILTMRGNELPMEVVDWTPLDPLGPLSLDAAREVFCSRADHIAPSDSLDMLLEAIDNVPLAIILLAQVAKNSQETPETLLEAWKHERTGLLASLGSTREDNIEVSIVVSLHSTPMKNSKMAMRLLAMIAYLPQGLPDDRAELHKITGLSPSDLGEAIRTLKRMALAHVASKHLTTLSPIREYIRAYHNISDADAETIHSWYRALLNFGSIETADASTFQSNHLTTESENIPYILSHLVVSSRSRSDVEELAGNILSYSTFLCWTKPNTDLLQRLLQEHSEELPDALKARLYVVFGQILYRQDQYNDAIDKLEKAHTIFQVVNNHDQSEASQSWSVEDICRMQDQSDDDAKGTLLLKNGRTMDRQAVENYRSEANCLKRLGDVLGLAKRHDYAKDVLKKGLTLYQSINDRQGKAQCLWSLGEIFRMQKQHETAKSSFEKALTICRADSFRRLEAWCLWSLGNIHYAQDQYDAARSTLNEACNIFGTMNDRYSQARCLRSLGKTSMKEGDNGTAGEKLRMARQLFEAVGIPSKAETCLEAVILEEMRLEQ